MSERRLTAEELSERREIHDYYKRKIVDDPANGITPDPRTRARWAGRPAPGD